jgi:hypothetical protein
MKYIVRKTHYIILFDIFFDIYFLTDDSQLLFFKFQLIEKN